MPRKKSKRLGSVTNVLKERERKRQIALVEAAKRGSRADVSRRLVKGNQERDQ